jgi:hypothetical protein
MRPARAAVEVGAAHQASDEPWHGVDVPLGQLVLQQVEISVIVAGVHCVPFAGENAVQTVSQQGEPGARSVTLRRLGQD